MISLLISVGVAAATCHPPAPNNWDVPFAAKAAALGQVSIEIPLVGSASAPDELLRVLNENSIAVTLLPSRTWASRNGRFLQTAHAQGNDVGIWF